MILLRDFGLYVLPVLVAAGGWLHALSLRKRARSGPKGARHPAPGAARLAP
jgi:hypothetical protein